ncbi:MAG: phage replisome organizer N-terminal domain-containing protein [Candidatus Onthovivens sp.]|nr:phage replisome organizer N-terminal domain-containing protein [Candidatus Onthovivens sp.]
MSKYDKSKFYWLQLKEDFFDEDAINWLEEQPNGKEYSLFYLKLCLKSLKTNGVLIRKVGNMLIPYDHVKLGELTKTNPDTVVVAMKLLIQIGLVEVLDNGEFFLTQVADMIGSQSRGAFKKEQQIANRNSTKLLKGGTEVEKIPPKIDIEKDIELDKEIEIDKDKEKKLSNAQEVKNLIENEFNNNQELLNAFNEFLKMRISKKAKNTAYAIKLLLNKLNQMALSDNEKLEIINQSIINGWQGLFPLKKNNYNNYNQQQEFDFTSKSDPNDFRKVSQEEQDEMQRRCDELGL